MSLDYDLSGVGVRLWDVPDRLSARLNADWSDFRVELRRPPVLEGRITFRDDPEPFGSSFHPKAMRSEFGRGRARFATKEGQATVDAAGQVALELASRRTEDQEYLALTNLVRACLAWLMPSRGGALLHAAGLVLDGRGFVLPGAAGSGKSTWARLGEQAGAHVVSDDLVMLDGAGERVELLGAPFRSTHPTMSGAGRWPLAAILFPCHGDAARCGAVPRWLAQARIVANLTFVADAVELDPRLPAVIDRLADTVPCAELTFALDPGFVSLLRGWDGSSLAER